MAKTVYIVAVKHDYNKEVRIFSIEADSKANAIKNGIVATAKNEDEKFVFIEFLKKCPTDVNSLRKVLEGNSYNVSVRILKTLADETICDCYF